MKLSDSLQMVKGVGPKNALVLAGAGLHTIEDFIDYWPRRYDDYSNLLPIASVRPGLVTVRGKFSNIRAKHSRRGLHLTEALLSDDTATMKVIWFNQPYRAKSINLKAEYFLHCSILPDTA